MSHHTRLETNLFILKMEELIFHKTSEEESSRDRDRLWEGLENSCRGGLAGGVETSDGVCPLLERRASTESQAKLGIRNIFFLPVFLH